MRPVEPRNAIVKHRLISFRKFLVPPPGLEPGLSFEKQILSLSCLPFHQEGDKRTICSLYLKSTKSISSENEDSGDDDHHPISDLERLVGEEFRIHLLNDHPGESRNQNQAHESEKSLHDFSFVLLLGDFTRRWNATFFVLNREDFPNSRPDVPFRRHVAHETFAFERRIA